MVQICTLHHGDPWVKGSVRRLLLPMTGATPMIFVELRIFGQAQAAGREPYAPFAWGVTGTRPSIAVPPTLPCQMEPLPICGLDAIETPKAVCSTIAVSPYATTGKGLSAAKQVDPTTSISTNAPLVATTLTGPRSAVFHQMLSPNTPYKVQAWRDHLAVTGLQSKYPTLGASLAHGFNAGIPKIICTFIPFNRIYLPVHQEAFAKHLAKEFARGRYLGPFSKSEVEELIGPFQTSPLSFVPKPNSSNFRGIVDFSHPRNLLHSPSQNSAVAAINDSIRIEDFQCTWGTFDTFELLVTRLPAGCQASCRDIAEAYRTIPLAPDQWPGSVIRISDLDEFAINTANTFGLVSGGGVFGQLADALVDLLRARGIGPITKWVDDFCLVRLPRHTLSDYNTYRMRCQRAIAAAGGEERERARIFYPGRLLPNGTREEFDDDMQFPLRDLQPHATSDSISQSQTFAYEDHHIDAITNELGVQWATEKHLSWTTRPIYLGFVWDLELRTISLSDAKRAKYLQAIKAWQLRARHTLAEVEELHGKLVHVSLVVLPGPARLTALETMLAGGVHRPHCKRAAPRSAKRQLEWWVERLSRPVVGRSFHSYAPHADFAAYSDASSSVGIGLVIGDTWCAYKLREGWKTKGRGIAWAEAIGFELLARTLILQQSFGPRVRIHGDNRVIVEGWKHRKSRDQQVNEVFARLLDFCEAQEAKISTCYVTSAKNPADRPSRGFALQGPYLTPAELPPSLAPFLEYIPSPSALSPFAGTSSSPRIGSTNSSTAHSLSNPSSTTSLP